MLVRTMVSVINNYQPRELLDPLTAGAAYIWVFIFY